MTDSSTVKCTICGSMTLPCRCPCWENALGYMTEKLPEAISESVLNIGGCQLRVYVLDNGQRIINADDLENFFCNGEIIEGDSGVTELAKFIHAAKP